MKLLSFGKGRAQHKDLCQREADVLEKVREIESIVTEVTKWITDIRKGSNISHANLRKLYWYLDNENFDVKRARRMLRQISHNQPWPDPNPIWPRKKPDDSA